MLSLIVGMVCAYCGLCVCTCVCAYYVCVYAPLPSNQSLQLFNEIAYPEGERGSRPNKNRHDLKWGAFIIM